MGVYRRKGFWSWFISVRRISSCSYQSFHFLMMRAAGTPGECGGHAYREALWALLPSQILRARGIVELGTAYWSLKQAVSMGETSLGEEDWAAFVLLWDSLDMSAWIMQLKCENWFSKQCNVFWFGRFLGNGQDVMILLSTLAQDWQGHYLPDACNKHAVYYRYMIETPTESDWPHKVHERL